MTIIQLYMMLSDEPMRFAIVCSRLGKEFLRDDLLILRPRTVPRDDLPLRLSVMSCSGFRLDGMGSAW